MLLAGIITVAEARRRGDVLTEVELTGDALIVHVKGIDRLWSLKSRLEIPLAHVLDAEADTQVAREWQKGLRVPGTQLPGVITAGTFFQDGDRVFWDVRDPERYGACTRWSTPSTTKWRQEQWT